MKCFGDKMKTFHCKVVLLDEQELIQELQETTSGQDLLDVVFQHLNLIETSYFGLRYIDPSNQTHWLDPNKRLFKQLKGTSPFTLYFSVKFYAADPTKLVEEITRYQFFLQIKQDILQGRLPVPTDLAAELGSLAVQSELGDYDPRRHSPGYVSEFRFVANQSVPLETKIAELHKKLVSYVPSKAELCYLEKVKWLDMYGVDLHPVLGEDSTEYFLGLTPSGIIVLRNKVKVGNYFWPRITKVYFKGRFFMLRVKDKNNGENTYGFETPSKSACKHLWQCCVEHHAFFRLTQAAGNNPQAMVTIGSKCRTASGRSEKEGVNEPQLNFRPQTDFARTPSRRYQRRIVEGAQDTPRTEEADNKTETRTIVSLPGTVTPVSHVYRSTSMTLASRSDSPRSIRSAPYPSGAQRPTHQHSVLSNPARREGRPTDRGESPRSVKSGSVGRTPLGAVVPRRTSSVESQSSADSRSCNRSCCRHRRSRGRSSDGESEASSRCSSSKGHRKHHHHRHHNHRRHRHHSDDSSEHHRHRHRRHRPRSSEKSEPQMVESSDQWARVQSGDTTSRTNTATVRDLTNGYLPSGHDDTEFDAQQTQHAHQSHHSSRRKYRKHRSPSESKPKSYPDEIRRHIEFNLQNSEGLSDAQLKEIPYTKVETAKAVKIKLGSPKNRRRNSPNRSKSSSEKKGPQNSTDTEKENKEGDNNSSTDVPDKDDSSGKITDKDGGSKKQQMDTKMHNGSLRQAPRSNQASVRETATPCESPHQDGSANSLRSSPTRGFSHPQNSLEDGTHQRAWRENLPNSSLPILGPKPSTWTPSSRKTGVNAWAPLPPNRHTNSDDQNMFKTCNYVTSSYNSTSESFPSPYPPPNLRSEGVSPPPLRDSASHRTQENTPGYRRDPEAEKGHFPGGEDFSNGFLDSSGGGFMAQSPTLLKNATMEKGLHFTAVLKPQPSPQSSVTSGISVGSSSVSISTDSSLARSSSRSYHHQSGVNAKSSSRSLAHEITPSSSPDFGHLASYDNRRNPLTPSSSEPCYMNAVCPSQTHPRRTNAEMHSHLDDALTQHSTNILILYPETNSSGPSSDYKTPTPTPRSSIISSIHCSDETTHIDQSYGPVYANSHIINSLKQHPRSYSRPSSSLDYYSSSPTRASKEVTPSSNTYTNETNKYSSLPRKPSIKNPFTKGTGCQTNGNELKRLLIYGQSEPDERFATDSCTKYLPHSTGAWSDCIETLPQMEGQNHVYNPSDTPTERNTRHTTTPHTDFLTNGKDTLGNRPKTDNNYPTNVHWKIYNWDTNRNGETWSNSLGRTYLPQDICNNQQASTTLAETNERDYQRSVLNREEYSSYDMKYDSVYNDKAKPLGYENPTQVVTLTNGFNSINRCYDENIHLTMHGNRPNSIFNDHGVKQEMNNMENDGYHHHHHQTKDARITNFYSTCHEVQKNCNDNPSDRSYHIIEKNPITASSVNFRNNYNISNPKLAKERPNSFSYTPKSKLSRTDQNNDYNIHAFDKYSNLKYESPRMFKPILKSFASENNLNSQTTVKERSKSTEALDNMATNLSNNKNRVRWNIQEKTKNIINLNDDNPYYKSHEYNTLNGIKPSNIQHVKNNVVYAGKGEIIEIKNNRIVNIKSKRQEPTALTFKKGRNSEGINGNRAELLRDEISTEL